MYDCIKTYNVTIYLDLREKKPRGFYKCTGLCYIK